jgi:hypothetical protein
MNKTVKVIAISVVTAFFFALPLTAQTTDTAPAGAPTSNLRNATASLYKTDVDNFLNVNNWSTVNLDGWFGFLQGLTPTPSNNFRGNLGYATKLNDLYLGFRYYGNIFQDTGGAVTNTLTPRYDPDTQQLIQLTETTNYQTNAANRWLQSTNQFDVLIGVAGMGIKVGFFESMAVRPTDGWAPRNFTKIDYKNGNIAYEGEVIDYSSFQGYMQPSVQWGTLLNVSGLTLKPRAGVSFNIYQNTLIDNYYANYTVFNGKPVTPKDVNRSGNNYGYLQPVFTVGADLGLPKKDNLGTTFTLDYAVNFNAYNNDYGDGGFSGSAEGPVSWTGSRTETTSISGRTTTETQTVLFTGGNTTPANNDLYTTRSQHTITPVVTLDKTVTDSLSLGLKIQAPITVTAFSRDRYTDAKTIRTDWNYDATNSADAKTVTETTVHTPYGLTEETEFKLAPSVRIGARYHLIPGRFTVNAGVQLDPMGTGWTHTTTTTSRNGGDGARTTETVKNGDGVVISKTDTTAAFNYEGTPNGGTDSSSVNSTWNAFNGSVAAGFLFNFNENIALDFMVNSGITSTNWWLNLTNVNVMFTFKFGSKAKAGNSAAVQSTNVQSSNVQSSNVAPREENVNENNN